MDQSPLLVWFRDGLRVAGHPALLRAGGSRFYRGVGNNYPEPIVDRIAIRALEAFEGTKE